jgi:asparagine synthase (glutamine-hydrolysing)
VFNEKKDIVLLFSGEHYTDPSRIRQLKANGHEFDTGNASQVVHLYEECGSRCFEELNGWFSGILYDRPKGEVTLFNDRYGMQRIYYCETGDAIYFASEAKALLAVLKELRQIDNEGLGQFFSCGCTLMNKCLFSGMKILPGGSAWVFQSGRPVSRSFYFQPSDWESLQPIQPGYFYDEFKSCFTRILPRYFGPGESIAMSLTGGLDTRLILACLGEAAGTMPCYTFGGINGETMDIKVSREVAQACHCPHYVLRLHEDFLSDFAGCAEQTVYLSDGCHEINGTHDLYLNRLARSIAPIRMTGKFGSEVLRGASTFISASSPMDLFDGEFRPFVDQSADTLSDFKKSHPITFSMFNDASWHEYGRIAVEQSQLVYRTPYMDNDLVKLMYQAPVEYLGRADLSLRLIRDGRSDLFLIHTDMGQCGPSNGYPTRLLRLLKKLIFKLEWHYIEGLPHALAPLDRITAPLHFSEKLFGVHRYLYYRIWFRDQLSGYVRDILLEPKTLQRPHLNRKTVEKIVRAHLGGRANYMNEISRIISAELVIRRLLEGIERE